MTLDEIALKIRRQILTTCYLGRGGHVPPSLSAVDILTELYFGDILRYDPAHPDWEGRDRFVLSKGHAALGLYSALCEARFFEQEALHTFCKPGTIFGGHPTPKVPGVEAATGALGHGLPFAVGLALSAKLKREGHLVYVLTGDGECQEGSIWEAALSIGNFRLNNLIWIIDHNRWQCTGKLSETMEIEPLEEKLRSFGLLPVRVDGHDFQTLGRALRIDRNALPERPMAVIAETVKGKGVPFIERKPGWHSRIPTAEEFSAIFSELGLTAEEMKKL